MLGIAPSAAPHPSQINRSFPSIADQLRLQISAPEVAEVASEGILSLLGFLQLIFPACGRRESFEFKFLSEEVICLRPS